jgi:multiple sugar transport system permease protein
MRFPGRDQLFILLLMTMMVPFEVTLVPNFILMGDLHWIDSYMALIIPWTASAFSIFLLRQFFRAIPQDLYDAAVMDGCWHLRFLWLIVLPLSDYPAIPRPAALVHRRHRHHWHPRIITNRFMHGNADKSYPSRKRVKPLQEGVKRCQLKVKSGGK